VRSALQFACLICWVIWVGAQRIAWFQVTISQIIDCNNMENEMISCAKFNVSDTIALH
jgi:hypothetical protein